MFAVHDQAEGASPESMEAGAFVRVTQVTESVSIEGEVLFPEEDMLRESAAVTVGQSIGVLNSSETWTVVELERMR